MSNTARVAWARRERAPRIPRRAAAAATATTITMLSRRGIAAAARSPAAAPTGAAISGAPAEALEADARVPPREKSKVIVRSARKR